MRVTATKVRRPASNSLRSSPVAFPRSPAATPYVRKRSASTRRPPSRTSRRSSSTKGVSSRITRIEEQQARRGRSYAYPLGISSFIPATALVHSNDTRSTARRSASLPGSALNQLALRAAAPEVGVRPEIVRIDALAHELDLADEPVETFLHRAQRLTDEVVPLCQFVPKQHVAGDLVPTTSAREAGPPSVWRCG